MYSIQFPDFSAGMLIQFVSESVMQFRMRGLQVLVFPTHMKQLYVHPLNQRMALLPPVKMCQMVEHVEKEPDQLINWGLQKHWHELLDNLPSENKYNKDSRGLESLETWHKVFPCIILALSDLLEFLP